MPLAPPHQAQVASTLYAEALPAGGWPIASLPHSCPREAGRVGEVSPSRTGEAALPPPAGHPAERGFLQAALLAAARRHGSGHCNSPASTTQPALIAASAPPAPLGSSQPSPHFTEDNRGSRKGSRLARSPRLTVVPTAVPTHAVLGLVVTGAGQRPRVLPLPRHCPSIRKERCTPACAQTRPAAPTNAS